MKRFLAFALVTTATTFAYGQQPITNRIHVDGPPDAVLELDDGDGWRPICNAPCHVPIPLGPHYRIAGPGIQPSRPFPLPAGAHLAVDTGSRELHTFGMVLIPVGGVSLTASLVLFLATIGYSCGDCVSGLADTTTANWGWGTLAVGAAALIGGVVLVTSTRTQVSFGEQQAWVRVQDPEIARMRRDAVKTTGAPVFAVSF